MKRIRIFKLALSATCLAATIALTTQPVGATPIGTINFSLDTPNSDISASPKPYGSVEIDLVTHTTATVTFTADPKYLFGAEGTAGLNVNGPFTLSGLTWTGGDSKTGFTQESGNEDGFGAFNLSLKGTAGYQSAVSSLTFTLTSTSASGWADAASILTPNSKGNSVAAHVFIGENKPTGYASGHVSPPAVPDSASTMSLLGLALLGVGSLRGSFGRN